MKNGESWVNARQITSVRPLVTGIVVFARGERQWRVAVLELDRYKRAFTLSSPRLTCITPAGLGGGRAGNKRFELIVDAIT
jgi:hypothetical protein